MTQSASGSRSGASPSFPEDPILVQVFRGAHVESVHRAAWVLTDTTGAVLEAAGDPSAPFFMRSSTKALQALPLIETGAAGRFGYGPQELALALASHNAESCHTAVVESVLARLELDTSALQCGPQAPSDPEARRALEAAGQAPSALHNNCSGKHAGFLALAKHLGEDPVSYLDPESQTQRLVRDAVLEMSGVEASELSTAVDGCSAPTFRFPLRGLATAFARIANPDGLAEPRRGACLAMLDAVARHPELIAGHHKRICTDLARVTGGRLFPKIGAEGVYGIGVRGSDQGLAIKLDDGGGRGLSVLILHLLRRFGLASAAELEELSSWSAGPIENWAGLEVGLIEVLDA
jgi:L-asparaginase II